LSSTHRERASYFSRLAVSKTQAGIVVGRICCLAVARRCGATPVPSSGRRTYPCSWNAQVLINAPLPVKWVPVPKLPGYAITRPLARSNSLGSNVTKFMGRFLPKIPSTTKSGLVRNWKKQKHGGHETTKTVGSESRSISRRAFKVNDGRGCRENLDLCAVNLDGLEKTERFSVQLCEVLKFNEINSALAGLALGDKRLRPSQRS